jgi:hypothetical protein
MQPETPMFMRDFVLYLGQRNRDAGRCANTPGVAPKGLVSMRPHDTADDPIRIPLRSKKYPGLYALIDAADLDLVKGYTWSVDLIGGIFYAATRPNRKTIRMHRLIMACPDGLLVDHINHDGLDNRRANLRNCGKRENGLNRRAPKPGSSTGFYGVEQRWFRFRAYVSVRGERINVGNFDTAEEAAVARDEAARRYHGELATLNFPDEVAA